MADLDSFFAKKDKKKLKGKKYTTTELIAKRLEDTERKVEKTSTVAAIVKQDVKKPEEIPETTSPVEPATETPNPTTETPAVDETEPVVDNKPVEEELWNDFKDDETVDVSNLRITKLNIEGEEEGRGGQGEGGEEGKENTGEDKKDGVWKIEEQKSLQSTICEAVDAGVDDGIGDVKGTFAAMNANPRWSSQLAKELQPSPLPRGGGVPAGFRGKKKAPDITSAMAFPSLADAQANTGRKKNQEDRDGAGGGGGGDGRSGGGNQSSGGGGLRGLLARQEAGGSSSGAYKPPMMRTSNRFGALTDQSSVMRHS